VIILTGLLFNNKNMSNLTWRYRYDIRSLDDFPVQNATTVTLSTWDYDIRETITTSKTFIIENWATIEFVGWDPFISGIVYTGVGQLFSWTDFSWFTLDHMFISTPLWTIFNINNAAAVNSQIFIQDSVFIDCLSVWVIKNISQFSGYFNAFQDIWQWFDFESVRLLNLSQTTVNSWKNQNTSMFTFDWDIDSIQFNSMEYIPNTNESVFDFKLAANIWGSSFTWNIYNNSLWGDLFASLSRNQTDKFINFNSNSWIPASIVFWNMHISTQQNVTASQNAVVVVNDSSTGGTNIWDELWDTSRFTFDSSLWRFTYTWITDTNVRIISSTSLERAVSGSNLIQTLHLLNGSEIAWSKTGTKNWQPTNITSISDVVLTTWDYIELAVVNTESSWGISITTSNFIINS